MSTNHIHVQCPQRAEGIGYPGSGVTDSRFWEPNPSSLEDQPEI